MRYSEKHTLRLKLCTFISGFFITFLTGCFQNISSVPYLIAPSPSPVATDYYSTPYPLSGPGSDGITPSEISLDSTTPISPTSGGTGITLSISGKNFAPGATVLIGTLDCPATVKSTYLITCIVPANTPSTTPYDVTVINSDLTTVTATAAFTHNASPTITSISPSSGGPGTEITITGTNLGCSTAPCTSTPTVAIDGYTCTSPSLTSNTSVKCTVPAHIPGSTDVVLTNPDTQTVTSSGGFTYVYVSKQIAVGYDHTCALINGGAKCWGSNQYGQLGNSTNYGSTTYNSTPLSVDGLTSGVVAITAGAYHTCAIVTGTSGSGLVKCWGLNSAGQLGNISTTDSYSPVYVKTSATPSYLYNVHAIAAGVSHTCAATPLGVYCWGSNGYGQLGNDSAATSTAAGTDITYADTVTPNPVYMGASSRLTNVRHLSAGGYHTCALSSGGSIYCWGRNDYGQLGDNSTTLRRYAVPVKSSAPSTITTFSAVAAGTFHTCGINSNLNSGSIHNGIQCWGYNNTGQVGDNTTTNRSTATDISLSTGVQSLSAGQSHTCAIQNGSMYCWGSNAYGQLGDTTTTDRSNPTAVTGSIEGAISIAAGGKHSCAITINGIQCWGRNLNGQLGNANGAASGADPVDSATPLSVIGSIPGAASTAVLSLNKSLSAVSLGYSHACTVIAGSIKCWGKNNKGQLGNGTTTDKKTPTAAVFVSTSVTALSVASGHSFSCGLFQGGLVKCWGDNTYGQLGVTTPSASFDSTKISDSASLNSAGGNALAQSLAVGYYHACAIVNGGVQCWGRNNFGQLGNNVADGSLSDSVSTPVTVKLSDGTALSGVQSITAGAFHTCALVSGVPYCWGYNSSNQLAITSCAGNTACSAAGLNCCATPYPSNLSGGVSNAQSIAAGAYHTCAIVNGGVQCWGYNGFGQLGNNTKNSSSTGVGVCTYSLPQSTACPAPTDAAIFPNVASGNTNYYLVGVTQLSAGANHTCAVASGAAHCWGYNGSGQLGNGTLSDKLIATRALNSTASLDLFAQDIFAGGLFSCVLWGGGMQCFGLNSNGQLGNDSTTSSVLPTTTLGF